VDASRCKIATAKRKTEKEKILLESAALSEPRLVLVPQNEKEKEKQARVEDVEMVIMMF